MGLQTTAVKTEDGKSWIINGRSFNIYDLSTFINLRGEKVVKNGSRTERKFFS